MYQLYDTYLGDRIVSSEIISDNALANEKSFDNVFSVLASASGERNLNIFLCNRSKDTEFELKFEFENNYTLKSETVFTAPNFQSLVTGEATKDVFTTTTTDKNIQNFKEYRMPSKSVIVLTLESDKDLNDFRDSKSDEGTQETVERIFSDTNSSWAKDEINKMAEKGFIKGTGDLKFDPEKSLTRGEFAAIVSRMLQLGTKQYTNQLFNDVYLEDWYFNQISAVYFEGIIKGKGLKKFCPDDVVTKEEATVIAKRIYDICSKENITIDRTVIDHFVFKDDISDWALDSVCFAVQTGLLNRMYENGYFNPKSQLVREEAVAMLYRLYDLAVQNSKYDSTN